MATVEPFMQALIRATKAALTEASEPWGERVYKDAAPQTRSNAPVTRPYVICMLAGGGVVTGKHDHVNVVWRVKVVAESDESAYAAKGRLSALLNNADYGSSKALDGGDDWDINSVHEERAIDFTEMVDGVWYFHVGADFRVLMNSKTII